MKKDPIHQAILESRLKVNRRQFLSRMSVGIGSAALGSLLIPDLFSRAAAAGDDFIPGVPHFAPKARSEEHTSELQSLMRISYAVFCLKKKKQETTSQPPKTTIHH